MEPTYEQINQWNEDPNNWKLGLFYYNKKDSRIFVDKRIKWMGITVNFANPKTYLTLAIAVAFFGFIVFMIDRNRN
jgi:uncharacterized membrane protein